MHYLLELYGFVDPQSCEVLIQSMYIFWLRMVLKYVVNFINIVHARFSYESASSSFSLVIFWLCNFFSAKILVQNARIKCWWKGHVIDKKLLLKVNVRELRVDQNYFFSNKMSLNRFVLIQTRQKKTVVTEPLRHRVIIFNGFFSFFKIIIRKLIQN